MQNRSGCRRRRAGRSLPLIQKLVPFRPRERDPVDALLIEAVREILRMTALMVSEHEAACHSARPRASTGTTDRRARA